MNVTTASAARASATRRRHAQVRRAVSTASIVALGLATIIAVMLIVDIRGTAAAGLAVATVVALSIGCFAAALFGNLALLGHRLQAIGLLGAAVTIASAAHTLWMAWAFFHAPAAFAEHGALQGGAILATFALAVTATLIRYTARLASTHPTPRSISESRVA